jgi:hypothetical protein
MCYTLLRHVLLSDVVMWSRLRLCSFSSSPVSFSSDLSIFIRLFLFEHVEMTRAYDHTRVDLRDAKPDIVGADYINANYIQVYE